MIKQKDKYTYTFSIKEKKYEIFFAEDEHIEIYEKNNPSSTGFIFDNMKKFILFVNFFTDIIEKKAMEND